MASFRVVVHCVSRIRKRVRRKKKYRKIRLAQRKTIKKVASETTATGHRNIPNTRQCRNSCIYATMHVKKLKRSGAIGRKRLFDVLQLAVGYSETLLESHVLSRILYISFVRFSLDLFFFLVSFFFSLFSLLATYPRFIYSRLLASSIVTRRER